MDNSQQPYVAPAGTPEPSNPVTVQSLAQTIANAGNDPAVISAQNNANTAQATANQSSQTDYTLPQLLQSALIPTLAKTSSGGIDPDMAKSTADLGQYLGDLSNPNRLLEGVTTDGVVLSPQQQRDIISGRLGSESANLSQDNLIAGLRSGGIANIIKNLSLAHQQQTAQYMNAAMLAKQIADQALQKAQLHMQAAESAAGILNASRGLDIQEKGLGIQQQQVDLSRLTNPLLNANQARNEMQQAAPGMSFDQFMARFENDPRLGNITPDELYNEYTNAGGKGKISSTDIVKYGLKTGNLPQQWGAYVQSAANPATIGGAVGGGVAALGGLALKLGLLKSAGGILNVIKGFGPAAEEAVPFMEGL